MGAAVCKLEDDPVVPVGEAPHHGRSTEFCRVMGSLRRARACAGRNMSIFKHFIQSPEERFSHSLEESKQFCVLVISFPKLLSPLDWDHGLWHLHLVMGKSDSYLDPLWIVRQLESFNKCASIGKMDRSQNLVTLHRQYQHTKHH